MLINICYMRYIFFDIHQVLKYLATPPRFRCRTTERRMSPHHERAATRTETQPEDQLRNKPKRPTDKRDSHQAKPKKEEEGGVRWRHSCATQGPAKQ